MLAIESSEVIGLRIAQIAAGGDSGTKEFQLMFTEKIDAGFEAGADLWNGGSPTTVVERYREQVASNVKRLTEQVAQRH